MHPLQRLARSRRTSVLRILYCSGLLVVMLPVHLRLVDYAFDDAYIHIRIAEHLLSGLGPYFNPREAVMASSSSAWTLALATLFATGANAFGLIAAFNALLTTLCVPVYGALIRRAAGRVDDLLPDVLATLVVVPLVAASSIGLMETVLALLVVGIGLLMLEEKRPLAFAFLAAAPFVRVELAVVLGVAAVTEVVTRSIRLRTVVLWSTVGMLPFVAYDLYFFGTLVPNAVHAKSVGYQLTAAQAFWRLTPWTIPGQAPLAFVALLPVALGAGGYLVLKGAITRTARLSYLSGLVIVGVYVATHAFVFEWYVPLYAVTLCWPVVAVALTSARIPVTAVGQRLACVVVVLTLALPAQSGFVQYVRGAVINPAYAPTFMQGARVQSYLAIGRELYAALPDGPLLTSEIGGLGLGFQGRLEDGFGLISPDAIGFHPMRVPEERRSGGLGAIPPGFVERVAPPIIVSYDIFVEAFLRSRMAERYVRVDMPAFRERDLALAADAGVPAELWGIKAMHVFFRRDIYHRWEDWSLQRP